ncbi:hypothetical protein [Kouleothrix sp.]|uniref:hypothetical protein n=1 Tax=Kouleothrix sp. TaxID=2779161 RepID=UPI00391A28E3
MRGDAEGRGIGKALVSAIEQAARERGADKHDAARIRHEPPRARKRASRLATRALLRRYIKHRANAPGAYARSSRQRLPGLPHRLGQLGIGGVKPAR